MIERHHTLEWKEGNRLDYISLISPSERHHRRSQLNVSVQGGRVMIENDLIGVLVDTGSSDLALPLYTCAEVSCGEHEDA